MGKVVVHKELGNITLARQNLETALRLATEQGKIELAQAAQQQLDDLPPP